MEQVVLQTLCYHNIFDYPLTLKELHRFLIAKAEYRSSLNELQFAVQKLIRRRKIKESDGFYFLRGREVIVETRKERQRYSQEKSKIGRRVACWLRFIPTIKMVALTGAVAMNNAKESDDIDFLVVVGANRLWLTRVLAVLLIELLGRRRKPGEIDVKDKICLNIFLDEKHLALSKKKRNLFVAHEIAQMKPFWQKDNTYQKFIEANRWLKKFLPNWKK
jgi:predicted nucleotidyltransferase